MRNLTKFMDGLTPHQREVVITFVCVLNVLFASLFCLNAVKGQSFSIEPIPEDSLFFLVEENTFYAPDSAVESIEIRKTRMTKEQALTNLYLIADNQKRIVEAAPVAHENFEKIAQLFEKESGESYDSQLKKQVLRGLQGNYTFKYLNSKLPVAIKGGKMHVDDTTSFKITVIDRATIAIRNLMGAKKHVQFKIQNNRLLGEYLKERVVLARRE